MTLTPEQEKDLRALALAFKADIDASTDDFYTIEECSEALARIRRALEEAQAKLKNLSPVRCSCGQFHEGPEANKPSPSEAKQKAHEALDKALRIAFKEAAHIVTWDIAQQAEVDAHAAIDAIPDAIGEPEAGKDAEVEDALNMVSSAIEAWHGPGGWTTYRDYSLEMHALRRLASLARRGREHARTPLSAEEVNLLWNEAIKRHALEDRSEVGIFAELIQARCQPLSETARDIVKDSISKLRKFHQDCDDLPDETCPLLAVIHRLESALAEEEK